MQPPQQKHSWINLAELKTQIIKKLGPERSKRYFDYLNRFLSLKMSKVEFDKICVRTIGKECIPLHNKLIHLILKNACTVKVGNNKPLDKNGSNPVLSQASSPLTFPNDDILSPSHRKKRTGAHDQRGGDHRSALAPDGKKNYYSSHDHQEVRKEPLHAPLGIQYMRAPPLSSKHVGVSDDNGLLDTITLRTKMELIVAKHGLQGVSMDCANTINNGLDAYLKSLIRSCFELNPVQPSLLDFRVAMEVNPRQLGEDWPVLLEKICTRAFEE